MFIYFEDGLNDKINLLVGALEIQMFVVLFDRYQKMEEVYNHKKHNKMKAYDFSKRSTSRTFSATP